MSESTNRCVFELGASVTAYEAEKYIGDLTNFINAMQIGGDAEINATQTEVIDTAGCQLIDMAILMANKREAKLSCKFSEQVCKAFQALGLGAYETA